MPASDARPTADAVPAAVAAVLATLRGAGFRAFLVGGCVRDLLRDLPVGDFDVTTDASPDRVLALFPRAVPTGIRHGTVMIPTADGPVDVTRFRAGERLEDDLAHRDFTINAIAWDPASGVWADPFGGAADLAAGRLRAVGSARERFAEDPLRALRGARLVATLGLAPEPELAPAMAEARAGLRGVARERVRRELGELLLAGQADRGLLLLRETGIEQDLAPGVRDDAPAVVAALPARLELRLAGWLRGARAEAVLLALRFGQRRARQVARLLARHPIDRQPLRSDADLRRLLARAGEDGVADLLALRRAELAAAPSPGEAALADLDALAARFDRLRQAGARALGRTDLALDGAAVMVLLGWPPGRRVGAALRHLAECVLEDPACNTREALAERLRAWAGAPARHDEV